MVIAHDDLAPHLDELNVIDKRDETGKSGSSNSGQGGNSGSQESSQQDMPDQSAVTGMSDREKIYQRGTDGLKEIKRERLKNWLSNTEGVGGQTESRILMVFNRNETIHQNPHILYNLLDDELSASPSYINTMVEDIFQPERENDDLLQQQGFTPWHMRNNGGGQQMQARGGGQPFNATGNAGGSFSPGGGQTVQQQSRQSQQQAQSQPQQSEQPQTQSQTQQTGFDNAQELDQNSGLDDYEPPGPEGSQYTPPGQTETPETTAEPERSTETTPEPNPKQIQNGMSAAPQSPQPEEPGATDPDRGTDVPESEGQDQTQNDTSDEQPDPEDEFESIFGDVTE